MSQLNVPTFCIITGGNKGIGKAIALQLAERFAHNSVLYLVARSKQNLDEVAGILKQRCGNKVDIRCLSIDLSQKEGVNLLIKETFKSDNNMSTFSHAILIHNAVSHPHVDKMARDLNNIDNLQQFVLCNVNGPIVITSAFLGQFGDNDNNIRKTIINVTSLAGEIPYKSHHTYGMAKAARAMFFRVMAMEEPNVKIMNFEPGFVDTDLTYNIKINCADEGIRSGLLEMEKTPFFIQPDECVKGFMMALEEDEYESGDIVRAYDALGLDSSVLMSVSKPSK